MNYALTKRAPCCVCGVDSFRHIGWLLVVENRWLDRLKILSWHASLATQTDMKSVCCIQHLKILISHWLNQASLRPMTATVSLAPVGATSNIPYFVADNLAITGSSFAFCLTSSSLPTGQVGVPYTATLTPSGGTGPYTFSTSLASLPPGLSVSAAGVISGTPTAISSSFAGYVTATDTNGVTTRIALTISVIANQGGPSACTLAGVPTPVTLRPESKIDQVADVALTCVGAGGATNIQLTLTAPVTSKVLNSGTGATEALAVTTAGAVSGTVSGSVVTFSGVAVPPGTSTVTLTNLRVNATALSAGASVTAQAVLSGAGVQAVTLPVSALGTVNLRHAPQHREPLWVADTVAWDCHRPVLDRAVQFGIVNPNELREPPLVYCSAEYSPATWVRGSRPNDGRDYHLGEARLPIPAIEIPWAHLGSAWEFLALHHEVGHDIEADLRLRPALVNSLLERLAQERVPLERRTVWEKWAGEVFADLCALQLGGPAFTEVLMHLLVLPEREVKSFRHDDPHPTPYTRILLNAAYIRTLGSASLLQEHAAKIEMRWKALYGEDSGNPDLDDFQKDFPCVFQALMEAQLHVLKGRSVRELIPFGDADDGRIRAAVKFFRTGMNRPSQLRPRYAVSAAGLATAAESEAGNLSDGVCVEIHRRVMDYVRESAPQGLRGGGPDPHEKFIAGFAKRIFPEWTNGSPR